MIEPTPIDMTLYSYSLPESSIAKYPLDNRDQSKLLYYDRGDINQHPFRNLPELLPEGSWLVFNNTRVIQARLRFEKPSGARIEIFCLEPVDPEDYQQSFLTNTGATWKCMVRNARKWKEGPALLSFQMHGTEVLMEARVLASNNETFTIQFSWNNSQFTFAEIIEKVGSTPIPPYLKREAEESDRERYQTVYSRELGSVAAPTAGLHFTSDFMNQLKSEGVPMAELSLHVGAGTFVPVKNRNARNHPMHAEQVMVPCSFLKFWMNHQNGLIAVGTTSTRSLESLYWLGVKLVVGEILDPADLSLEQWENERLPGGVQVVDSLTALLSFCEKHALAELVFSTQLMIIPGYQFRAIGGLITNFHLPGSTLLLLIAALIGDDWKEVYDFALKHQFRFLSYGDSSLLIPEGSNFLVS